MGEATSLVRRDVLIGGACLAGAAVAGSASVWSVPRALPAGGLEALIPKRIGDWTLAGTDGILVAEEGDRARGPYDDLLTRIYTSASFPPVTLLVAYIGSQRADVRLHRPEACYPAAGFALRDRRFVEIELPGLCAIPAQIILAQSASRAEQLVYWTRVGGEYPTSNVAQLEAFVRANLAGTVPDAVLVRLSVPGSDRSRAWTTIQAFLVALLACSTPSAVRTVFGDAERRDGPILPRYLRKGVSTT